MRVANDHPVNNGGWLWPLDGTTKKFVPITPQLDPPHINATKIMRDWRMETTRPMVDAFADDLGVTSDSLLSLGIGWAHPHNAWAFPMKDAYGNTIGIRLRSNVRKWAVLGSKAGLFFGPSMEEHPTCVLEGPTDTAAALSIGLDAIGRPSCQGQEQMLCDRLRHAKRVLIIADNDEPGQRGAERLQPMLRCPTLIWFPPCKDMRGFVRGGGTKELIEVLTRPMRWTLPTAAQ